MQNVIPLAITGPAAIPRKNTTPIIVPAIKVTVISGWFDKRDKPFADKSDTRIPLKIVIHPIGDLKALNKW